jgi:hypothetical protein
MKMEERNLSFFCLRVGGHQIDSSQLKICMRALVLENNIGDFLVKKYNIPRYIMPCLTILGIIRVWHSPDVKSKLVGIHPTCW